MTILPKTGLTGLDAVLGALACVLVLFMFKGHRTIPKGLQLPPGPRGKFILGNVDDMPTHHEWETFTQWAKEYGNLVYVKVFRQPMIFINSAEVAHDLLEKRSSYYSDRFSFPMLNDLMGFNWNFGFMPYGERWRRHRKIFNLKFNSTAVAEYHDIQTTQARHLLRDLHQSPEHFTGHFHHFTVSVIMEIVYGIKILPKDDPYVQVAENAFKAGLESGNPGSFLVDALPILKYVPEWMPGAGFQKKARVWRELLTQMPLVPFMAVKDNMRAGSARPSFVSSLLEQLSETANAPEEEEAMIRDAGAAAYIGGADTISTALQWFILAMLTYPAVQKKAQAELDSQIGMDRLPGFEDLERLPYVNVLCKEVHRWNPVAPLGIAHRVMQDDVYGEYFIPKGSIVIANSWALLHDEGNYGTEPAVFNPDRFLRAGVKDPTPAFGYGRRICPGRDLADNSLFIAAASILKVFDILPPQENGNDSSSAFSSTSGFSSRPEPFKCRIKARIEHDENLVVTHVDGSS